MTTLRIPVEAARKLLMHCEKIGSDQLAFHASATDGAFFSTEHDSNPLYHVPGYEPGSKHWQQEIEATFGIEPVSINVPLQLLQRQLDNHDTGVFSVRIDRENSIIT